jgi:phage terminase large subunit-like protein
VAGRIRHDGNPVLAWMMGNAMVQRDAHDNMKVVKPQKSGGHRVDGVVASVMALSGVLAREPEYVPQIIVA